MERIILTKRDKIKIFRKIWTKRDKNRTRTVLSADVWYGMARGDSMISVKKLLTWIFLKNSSTCSQGSTVYQKNKNNFVGGFVMGENHQKSQKFSLLVRVLKLSESVDQYLFHVNCFKFSNFHQFFRFFNWLPIPPIFSTSDIIRYIYRAYKISTISDVRHDEAYF